MPFLTCQCILNEVYRSVSPTHRRGVHVLSEVGIQRRGLESARIPTHLLDSANMLLLVNSGATMRRRKRWA